MKKSRKFAFPSMAMKKSIIDELSIKIKIILADSKLTLKEFGRSIGIDQAWIGYIKNRFYENISDGKTLETAISFRIVIKDVFDYHDYQNLINSEIFAADIYGKILEYNEPLGKEDSILETQAKKDQEEIIRHGHALTGKAGDEDIKPEEKKDMDELKFIGSENLEKPDPFKDKQFKLKEGIEKIDPATTKKPKYALNDMPQVIAYLTKEAEKYKEIAKSYENAIAILKKVNQEK